MFILYGDIIRLLNCVLKGLFKKGLDCVKLIIESRLKFWLLFDK